MAVAYWGAGAADMLGLNSSKPVTIVCDLRSGACNPNVVGDLLDLGFKIIDRPGLHAKVYVSDSSIVVCSANASANGLGEEGAELVPDLEAGIFTDDPDAIAKASLWFDRQALGPAVDRSVLPELKALWNRRRRGRPVRRAGFVETLLTTPERLADRRLRAAFYKLDEPPKEHAKLYKSSEHFNPDDSHGYPYFWGAENWKMKVGDRILCFELDGRQIACTGIWEVLSIMEGGKVVPLARIDAKKEFHLTSGDRKLLTKAIRAAHKDGRWKVDGPIVSLENFAKKARLQASPPAATAIS